eukprot:jgi/Astpho2/7825/Aster-06113
MSETSEESSLEQAERVSLGSLSSRNPPTDSDGRCTSIEQAEGVRLGNSPRWPTAGHSLPEGGGSPLGSRQGSLRDQAAEHGGGAQPYLAGQRVWYLPEGPAGRAEGAVVLAPGVGKAGTGMTLVHLDSSMKVIKAAPAHLRPMETSGGSHPTSRVWCKRKAGSKLSGIVVTADSSAAPAAREAQQVKSKDSMVYVGEDAEDMLNRLSSGALAAESGHIIGLEALFGVPKTDPAPSGPQPPAADAGHLCARTPSASRGASLKIGQVPPTRRGSGEQQQQQMPLLPAQQPRAELPSLPAGTSSDAPCMPVSTSSQFLEPPTPDLAQSLGLHRHPQESGLSVSSDPKSIGSYAGSPTDTLVCDPLLPPLTPTRGSEASSPNTTPSTPCAGSRTLRSPGGQPDEAAAQEQLAPAVPLNGHAPADVTIIEDLEPADVPCGFVPGPFRMRILAYEILPKAQMVYWKLQADGTPKRVGPSASKLGARFAGLCDLQHTYFEMLEESKQDGQNSIFNLAGALQELQEACELIIDSICSHQKRQ